MIIFMATIAPWTRREEFSLKNRIPEGKSSQTQRTVPGLLDNSTRLKANRPVMLIGMGLNARLELERRLLSPTRWFRILVRGLGSQSTTIR